MGHQEDQAFCDKIIESEYIYATDWQAHIAMLLAIIAKTLLVDRIVTR